MSSSQRRIAATLVAAALIAAAVALVCGGTNPVSAFIAEVTGGAADGAGAAAPAGAGPGAVAGASDAAIWDDDGDDADAAVWSDPAVHPLRVRVVSPEQTAVGG